MDIYAIIKWPNDLAVVSIQHGEEEAEAENAGDEVVGEYDEEGAGHGVDEKEEGLDLQGRERDYYHIWSGLL